MRRAVALVALTLALLSAAAGRAAVEGDIVFKRKPDAEQSTPAAVFPHWFHRIRFKCYVCHDAIVQMKAGANDITMNAIQQGKFCGVCHNGQVAFEVGLVTCPRCHRE